MNIILINHYAGSVTLGMEFRPYYLAREWVRMGHDVTILASSFSHLRKANPDIRKDGTVETADGIRYVWFKGIPYSGNGVKRALGMFQFTWKLTRHTRRLAKVYRPDAVIASSTYPLDTYPARRIAKRAGAALIHEVHDLWPLTLTEIGGMSKKHLLIRVLQRAEDSAYSRSDAVVSLLPGAFDYMRHHGLTADRFAYIPNGVSEQEWAERPPIPAEMAARLAGLRKQGYFLLGFAGGHALSNALDTLLEVAGALKGEKIAVVLVGDGAEKPRLMNRAKEMALDNVFFFDPVSKAMIPSLLSHFDALYLGWNKCELYQYGVSANKLFDYMMAGKPVVHAFGYPNDPVAEAGCGLTVSADDVGGIADAVRGIRALPSEEREKMGQAGRAFVLEHHVYSRLASRFIELTEEKQALKRQ